MGSDTAQANLDKLHLVSIHAPTWGATTLNNASKGGKMFQSTLPHGERLRRDNGAHALRCFNPRSHMGSDSNLGEVGAHIMSFNPRSHMGSDAARMSKRVGDMFQSTLPHGERHLFGDAVAYSSPVSIHAPTWGATDILRHFSFKYSGFNPRSHMGSDS